MALCAKVLGIREMELQSMLPNSPRWPSIGQVEILLLQWASI